MANAPVPMIGNERWRAVSPLLDKVLDLPADQRPAWLASLRAQDAALAADVEALLAEHETLESEGFLADDAPPLPAQTSLAGLTIGAYTLRSLIGQGGYGSVWLAERNDGRFEGVAAVKLLNVSLIGRTGEARFKREGSVLARLRHPCIAHLIDAGVSSLGQPYLVLEHVDGEPIDGHCDARTLPIEARIRLFLDVLAAVSFAHANLIVHRDIKPANVLVGSDGQVKLLDFGIAKLLESETGGGTALTREGEAVMTPDYAAPEQLTAGTITTTTDVYALGVLLYRLLTGQHPAGRDIKSTAELVKAIVETQPPRLSDAVVSASRLPQGELAAAAARRGATPERLKRQLQGDLDNIAAKALKKQPSERYLSVGAFADDLRRHLAHQPVSARADALGYRAAKFVRRNRAGVAAACLAIAAVLSGTAGVAWQAREARIQRDAAQTQLARATAAGDFMAFLLSVAAPSGQRFSVSDLLDQGEALIDKQFAADDALRAEMLATVGYQYLLSERWDKARPVLERAAELAKTSDDPALKARAMCPLALLRMMHGEGEQATEMMVTALAGLVDEPRFAVQRAECLIRFAEFSFFTGDAEAMIANATAAIELLDTDSIPSRSKHVDARAALAYGLYLAQRYGEADEVFAQVMEGLAQVGRDRTIAASDTLNNWSLVHYSGDIARAEPLIRRSVELRRSIEGSDTVAPTQSFNLAGLLLQLGRLEEAEELLLETVRTAAARQEHRIQYDAMMELVEVYVEMGDLGRATAQMARVDAIQDQPRFDDHRRAQRDYYLGRLLEARGDPEAARARFETVVSYFERTGRKLVMQVLALLGLSRTELAPGHTDQAMATAEKALALARSYVEEGAPSYLVGHSLAAIGDVHRAAGRAAEARDAFERARDHLQKTLGPDHPAAKSAREKAAL